MGWCSGDVLLAEVWSEIEAYIPKEAKKNILKKLIVIFENEYMDCYDNIEQIPEGKQALMELNPNWDWSWE